MAFNYPAYASRVGTGVVRGKEGVFDTKSGFLWGDGLYPFISFIFTNAGATGRLGPTLANCLASYNTVNDPWLTNTSFFNVPNDAGIQYWTVPTSGTYRIKAYGARGGTNTSYSTYSSGEGAIIQGDFSLATGDTLKILVGQEGESGADSCGGMGGGGGTFVTYTDNSPLIVAGGGSGQGAQQGAWAQGQPGLATQNGGDQYQQSTNSSYWALGGQNGNGGGIQPINGCVNSEASAGGGLLTDGSVAAGSGSVQSGGQAFVNGGLGAQSTSYREGGFGGGGGARYGSGGGGGYSGGAAGGLQDLCSCSYMIVGGGGGSYNNGANQSNQQGGNAGHGKVEITLI